MTEREYNAAGQVTRETKIPYGWRYDSTTRQAAPDAAIIGAATNALIEMAKANPELFQSIATKAAQSEGNGK